jgi:hypothetical protein
MDQSIKAGIVGAVLAVIVNVANPLYLSFLPTFMIAIIVIFIYRLGTLKDGLIAAFMTYIFNEGILTTLYIALLYAANQPYPTVTIDTTIILSPILSAISAVIAAYIGVWLARKRTQPPQKTQPQSTDLPQDLQTV